MHTDRDSPNSVTVRDTDAPPSPVDTIIIDASTESPSARSVPPLQLESSIASSEERATISLDRSQGPELENIPPPPVPPAPPPSYIHAKFSESVTETSWPTAALLIPADPIQEPRKSTPLSPRTRRDSAITIASTNISDYVNLDTNNPLDTARSTATNATSISCTKSITTVQCHTPTQGVLLDLNKDKSSSKLKSKTPLQERQELLITSEDERRILKILFHVLLDYRLLNAPATPQKQAKPPKTFFARPIVPPLPLDKLKPAIKEEKTTTRSNISSPVVVPVPPYPQRPHFELTNRNSVSGPIQPFRESKVQSRQIPSERSAFKPVPVTRY